MPALAAARGLVTPLITLGASIPTHRCDGAAYWQWVADARSLLPKYNYDENKFDHLVVDLPVMQDCNGVAGQGEVGELMDWLAAALSPLKCVLAEACSATVADRLAGCWAGSLIVY